MLFTKKEYHSTYDIKYFPNRKEHRFNIKSNSNSLNYIGYITIIILIIITLIP